jgi:UDP-glucose 4-epimerase
LFIYLSSMAVFGEASAPLDETAVPHPRTAYGVSKLEAERLVRSAGEGPGFATIVVRPPMVYGPGMKGNPLRLFRWIHSGRSVPFGSIHNLRSILYSGNLTAALIRIMECAADRSDLFHVADPDPVSLRDLSRWIGADFDAEGRIVAIPPWLLAWTARCMSAVPERFRLGAGGAELRRAMQDFVVDTRRIQRTLGFEAPFGTREGVALTAQWFRRAHAPSATAGQVS